MPSRTPRSAAARRPVAKGRSIQDQFTGFDPSSGVQHVDHAEDGRDLFQRMLRKPLSGVPKEDAGALTGLLRYVIKTQGHPALYPSVQQELRVRANDLLDSVLNVALPNHRENAKLPTPKQVDALVLEAKALLGMAVDLASLRRLGPGSSARATRARTATMRRQLVEQWVATRLPLSATGRDVRARSAQCVQVLAEATGRAPASDALELVAKLLGSTPGMIKKLRARRLHR